MFLFMQPITHSHTHLHNNLELLCLSQDLGDKWSRVTRKQKTYKNIFLLHICFCLPVVAMLIQVA